MAPRQRPSDQPAATSEAGPARLAGPPSPAGPAGPASLPGPAPDRRGPSMADVAELAGYSHQTVSRVLSGHPNVRPHTKARVLAAIAELGYRPNLAARALATGRTRTLGVVCLNSTLYGPASMLYAIEEAAQAADYWVTAASVRALDRTSLRKAVARLVDQGVDGIVVIAPLTTAPEALAGLPADIPVVTVEGDPAHSELSVRVDQELGGRLATEHLLAQGHRTVWHVAGPPEWLDARARITGWRAALDAAGAEVVEPLAGDWSAGSGYRAGQILARVEDLTAVFVANDPMALGVLRALHERGRRVPEEVSVVGFDDVPESGFYNPPLTTVRQNFDEVGARALRLLLDRIAGRAAGRQDVVVVPQLVVRASVAGPARSR